MSAGALRGPGGAWAPEAGSPVSFSYRSRISRRHSTNCSSAEPLSCSVRPSTSTTSGEISAWKESPSCLSDSECILISARLSSPLLNAYTPPSTAAVEAADAALLLELLPATTPPMIAAAPSSWRVNAWRFASDSASSDS